MPTYGTHDENCIDAQNPKDTCPLKLFAVVK